MSRDPSASSGSNPNDLETDLEQTAHPDTTSNDKMDIDAPTTMEPPDDASSYHGSSHANIDPTSSDPDGDLINDAHDDNQDKMAANQDDQSGEEPENAQDIHTDEDNEGVSDEDLAESMPPPGYDSSNDEYQPSDEDDEGSGDDHSNINTIKPESPEAREGRLGASTMDRMDSDIDMTNGNASSNEVEVPSSVPYKNGTSIGADVGGHTRTKSSSGRKRFAKPSFYNRVPTATAENSHDHASPAAAAASRRGTSQRHGPDDDNNASAGPSNAAEKGKGRQTKISTMLKGKSEDSPDPEPYWSRRRVARKKIRPEEVIKGPFSEFELRNIGQAVERWREDHNMTQFQINELIQGPPRDMKSGEFWDHVAETCPNRRRQKVINQCRRKYHNFVARGTWTYEQHEELKAMWERHGNKYAVIGKLINRHPEDVRDRVRNYVVCGDNRRVEQWDESEQEKLTSIVGEAIEHIQKERAGGRVRHEGPDDDLVDWQAVSEKMGRTRSRLQCIQKWKAIKAQTEGGSIDGETLSIDEVVQRAREEAADMPSQDRYRIVRAVRTCGANADSRIPWAKISVKKLGRQWARSTIMLVWYRLKRSIADWKIMSVPEIADQLTTRYRETHELDFPSEDDLDSDAEYREIEHKAKKIMKTARTPKSARLVVKSDEDEDDSVVEYETQDEEDMSAQDTTHNDRGSSIDLGLSMEATNENGPDEDEQLEIEDSEPDVKAQLSNKHDSQASVGRESSMESAASISDFVLRKAPKGGKVYSASNRIAKSQNITPENLERIGKKKPGELGEGGRYSAKKLLSGHKGKRASLSKPKHEDTDGPSSDTNASDVESIPAHR
ncbi:hypothetical protein F4779DRAFT_549985 [Xylariaceae sp. FL0662B]|nr:hypothetical protein F4779DRAFT_549985 [Xylariaceae sp. FL0662B]